MMSSNDFYLFKHLYAGQKIGLGLNGAKDVMTDSHYPAQSAFTECLELKNLKNISKEDADWIVAEISKDNKIKAMGIKDSVSYCINSIGKDIFKNSNVVDYLRTRGYALPFNGYTVEDFIQASKLIFV